MEIKGNSEKEWEIMSSLKVAIYIGLVVFAILVLGFLSPTLVSAKSTYSVFVGIVLAVLAVVGLAYTAIDLNKYWNKK